MKIAIIGGGIAGLTTGLALKKVGFDATVYEKADALNEIGAGIWLQPNAMKILDWLGIGDTIRGAGYAIDTMEITYPDLKPVKKIAEETVQKDAFRTIAIHRGNLQKILYAEFTKKSQVILGNNFTRLTNHGDKLHINFNEEQVVADLLIGADGLFSQVRKQLISHSELRDSDQYCWRGIAQYRLPADLQNKGKEAWGKGIRFGFSNVDQKNVYWFAVAKYRAELENFTTTDLANLFQSFHPVVGEMIENTKTMHQTKLQDLKRLPTWQNGKNICLIGDAAHATTPNMGQGAGQGIEDAYYLSNLLKIQNTPGEALQLFENQRRKKVDYVVNTSWNLGKMAHSQLMQPIVKTLMKITPQKTIKKQMDNLYTIEKF